MNTAYNNCLQWIAGSAANQPQVTCHLLGLLLSRSPDEIRVGITFVFFLLLYGCYEGFSFQVLRQIVLFPWLRGYVTHTGV